MPDYAEEFPDFETYAKHMDSVGQIEGLMNYISKNGDKRQRDRMFKIVDTFINRLLNIDSEIEKE